MSDIEISVCVCTRNRPQDVRRAVRSVIDSETPAHQIVVADDSTDGFTRDLIADEFPGITYVPGPRQGLGANRNAALFHVRGSHLLFLDDDAALSASFLGNAAAFLSVAPAATIVTGTELNGGQEIAPHKPTFLGHQSVGYAAGDAYETVVINATVFPRRLFSRLRFDPSLVYGYDEVDIAARAVLLHGYTIVFRPQLCNAHYPSAVNRALYMSYVDASRIYVTFKRYYWLEHKRGKAVFFLLLAWGHFLVHALRRKGARGLGQFWSTLARSSAYVTRCWLEPEKYV